DHLVVIGRGKLIADSSTQEFIDRATKSTVRVRSPRLRELGDLLRSEPDSDVDAADVDALTVTGVPIERIGEVASGNGITLHELAPHNGSLEQAFIELTGQSAEFASHWNGGAVPGAGAG